MQHDRFEKMVVIPTRIVNGTFRYFNGGPFPKLKEGTKLKVVVSELAIENIEFLKILEAGHKEDLLPKNASIYAAVSLAHIPQALEDSALSGHLLIPGGIPSFPDTRFVEIVLEEPLFLYLRGTKLGRLSPVKCRIPSLKKEALSLNHAFRLISEEFEPHRISHGGNVFQRMLYIYPDKQYYTLEDLRDNLEKKYQDGLHKPTPP
jgi:hypothetical protein